MTVHLKKPAVSATPIHIVDRGNLDAALAGTSAATRHWLAAIGFNAAPDNHAMVADADGRLQSVWAGVRNASHP